MHDVIIIGGGLSGLTLAYNLHWQDIKYKLLEASGRLGGRIQTANGQLDTPLELGASWFSDRHPCLISLVTALGMDYFPQFSEGITLFQSKSFESPQKFYIPAAESPSFRISGGSYKLIETLANTLDATAIRQNTRIVKITGNEKTLTVIDSNGIEEQAKIVVCCLPPQLLHKISYNPHLPGTVMTLLPKVQTWMEGAIKFAIEYEKPFWRQNGFSGMVYSQSGLIAELYDHTNGEGTKYSLAGFLNGSAASYSTESRQEIVIKELTAFLGPEAGHYIAYLDKIWIDGNISAGSQAFLFPHENNGHVLLRNSYMHDRLFFCGTETSASSPGYMEGAVTAANETAAKVLDRLA